MNQIIFEKLDLNSLKKDYICYDMHIHSEYSSDCNSKVKGIIKKSKQLGIKISITDHNEIKGSLEAYKIDKNIVIPGIEARSKESFDILFYFNKINDLKDFYKKVIEPNKKKMTRSKLPALKLIEASKKYNCISCIAHPFRPSPKRMFYSARKIGKYVDAVEVINSKNFRIFNKKAINFAAKNNKMIIGGSDSHTIRNIGTALTCIKKNKNIINEISSYNTTVIGKEINMIFAVISSVFSFIRKIRLPGFS